MPALSPRCRRAILKVKKRVARTQPFEHVDYIMLLFHNEQDFQQACERLQIRKVQITYPGGRTKVGLGRCVDGAKAMRMLMEART